MKILPYGHQHIDDSDIAAVVETMKSDFLTQGPQVDELERELCNITGAKYCVAVSSATAALHIAVSALSLKVGSEGITSPNTFLASANCLVYNRLVPRFADIDARTYCIDPKDLKRRITPKTRVVIPVDFAGQPADMPTIKKTADENDIRVIEDAAHALGSRYENGKAVGSCEYSDMTVFSFHPVKTITTGEGGAITTNNEKLYSRLRLLRSHGITKDPKSFSHNPGPWYYEMQDLGYNYRLTDIQAALGISQLRKLYNFSRRRREIVNRYNLEFSDLPNITTPYEKSGLDSCFHLYVLQIDFQAIRKTRKQVMAELMELGVGTQVHYIPIHTQPYYQKKFKTGFGDFPVAESYYMKALSIPLFPDMSDEDVFSVVQAVKEVCS